MPKPTSGQLDQNTALATQSCLCAARFDVDTHQFVSSKDDIQGFLKNDLDFSRLLKLQFWFKFLGRKSHVRPLHDQRAHSRTIVVLEQADMHMLWTGTKIYLKPLPRYLLSTEIWETYFLCIEKDKCSCRKSPPKPSYGCKAEDFGTALGFLHSYIQLIQYESDFAIALEARLVPKELDWPTWVNIVDQVLSKQARPPKKNKRFEYGEMRLSRIDAIASIPFLTTDWNTLRGYYFPYTEYSQRFEHSFRLLFTVFVYFSIVLAALQVGLAIDNVKAWPFFMGGAEWSIRLIMGFILFAMLRIVFLIFVYASSNAWATRKWLYASKKAEESRMKQE
jgi:hypothetical protein